MTSSDATRAAGALAALAVVLLVAAAVGPTVVSSRPAYEIPVREVHDGDPYGSPTSSAWLNASSVEVPLSSAPSGLPNANDTSVGSARVRAVRTAGDLYVRVSWADGTADRNASSPREFADAAAVELPVNTSARPPIAMGSTKNPVNVWYWSGSSGTEEILAGGPGTTTQFPDPAVETAAAYEDGEWHVVFHRNLTAAGTNRTEVRGRHDLDVAFAVWNGSNQERAGRKAVSEWYYFPFGPRDQGPPYEAILWTVAGLAVLVVAVVTIEGVRRTRRESDRGGERR